MAAEYDLSDNHSVDTEDTVLEVKVPQHIRLFFKEPERATRSSKKKFSNKISN